MTAVTNIWTKAQRKSQLLITLTHYQLHLASLASMVSKSKVLAVYSECLTVLTTQFHETVLVTRLRILNASNTQC